MKQSLLKLLLGWFLCCAMTFAGTRAFSFALLGPYENWMQPSNNFRLPEGYDSLAGSLSQVGDIGGPLWISNGYRWNVPIVTYGFDPSFVQFFGTNGIAAVQGAIQTFNELPTASSLAVSNYPVTCDVANSAAQTYSLLDLRSETLAVLLEQMGLASPVNAMYVMRQWTPMFLGNGTSEDWGTNFIPQYVVMRNFDPYSLAPSVAINGILYKGFTVSFVTVGVNKSFIESSPWAADGNGNYHYPVAANLLQEGEYYTGLTQDDVGGLKYLYSTNTINYETLLSSVSGTESNTESVVNGAWRPGVDKITFVPQPATSTPGQFLAMTNQYNDCFFTNGILAQQRVQRVITKPDILFCAGDTGQSYPFVVPYVRTGTSNWIDNAASNGRGSSAGPGVIDPQVRVTFTELGKAVTATGTNEDELEFDASVYWGTFDQSTNPPVIYPQSQPATNQMLVRLWIHSGVPSIIPGGQKIEFLVKGQTGTPFIFEESTNLTQWFPLDTNEINARVWTVLEFPQTEQRFYRVIPQSN